MSLKEIKRHKKSQAIIFQGCWRTEI